MPSDPRPAAELGRASGDSSTDHHQGPSGTHLDDYRGPWGRAGYLLESRGSTTPWRMALRTPTFANVQVLEAVLPGTRVDDVEATIASLGWTLGDLDK